MLDPIIQSLQALIQSIAGYALGTNEFYTVFGIALFGYLLAARLLVGLFGSRRGILLTSLGVMLPVLLGALAYALTEVYAVPKIQADWVQSSLPAGIFALIVLLATLVLTRRFFDMNGMISVVILLLSLVVGVGGYFCSGVVVDFLNDSSEGMEQREQNLTEEIQSIHP